MIDPAGQRHAINAPAVAALEVEAGRFSALRLGASDAAAVRRVLREERCDVLPGTSGAVQLDLVLLLLDVARKGVLGDVHEIHIEYCDQWSA